MSTVFQSPTIAIDASPAQRGLYYGGAWHVPHGGYAETFNPATGESLGNVAQADAEDVDLVARAAHAATKSWRATSPQERAKALKRIAHVLRDNAPELMAIEAANCGNAISAIGNDPLFAAAQIDFFAGLVTELKGDTIPMNDGVVNMTVQEPYGVVARIVAFNHPLMFAASKLAAPLAAGNTVIIKPPPQAPLAVYRMMELIDGILPPGVLNMVAGGLDCGEALIAHHLIPVVTLIGSAATGRAIASAAAPQLKHLVLELGGKNALIVYPDADVDAAIAGIVRGMNFMFCGQSCGSTSRVFIHESLYDRVLAGVAHGARSYRPGLPADPKTTMGAIISKKQFESILGYIESGKAEGARLVTGGGVPTDPELANGFFIEPTVFGEVTMAMRIATEEIFGPVLSVFKWSDEDAMFDDVNAVEYGLTASIYTTNLRSAHRGAARVEAGYVWINNAAAHFPGAPFGGYKQSGLGREECLAELYEFSQTKNINITL